MVKTQGIVNLSTYSFYCLFYCFKSESDESLMFTTMFRTMYDKCCDTLNLKNLTNQTLMHRSDLSMLKNNNIK